MIVPSLAAQIAELEERLRLAVVEDEADGQRTKYDLNVLNAELLKLKNKQDPSARPVASRIELGGF